MCKYNSTNMYWSIKRNPIQTVLNKGTDLLAQVTEVQRLFGFSTWFDLDHRFVSLYFFQLCLSGCVGFVFVLASLMVAQCSSLSPDVGNQPSSSKTVGIFSSFYHLLKQNQLAWTGACLCTNWLKLRLPPCLNKSLRQRGRDYNVWLMPVRTYF